MEIVVVRSGQTLLDLAIQTKGDAGTALALAVANGMNLTDDLTTDQQIEVPDVIEGDENIHTYYTVRGYYPASAVTTSSLEGIDFWGIEYNFVVQ